MDTSFGEVETISLGEGAIIAILPVSVMIDDHEDARMAELQDELEQNFKHVHLMTPGASLDVALKITGKFDPLEEASERAAHAHGHAEFVMGALQSLQDELSIVLRLTSG